MILNTEDLRKEIVNCIDRVLPNCDLSRINFKICSNYSPEGEYIFSLDNKYHYVFTEKGKIRIHKEFETVEEVLQEVINEIVFEIALDYATKNKIPGVDFRRKLFAKEIELCSKFGNEFKEKREKEVNEILKNNPYIDI